MQGAQAKISGFKVGGSSPGLLRAKGEGGIVFHPGHKPDLLPGPAGKLPVSSIPLVEDDPTASRQFEPVQELDVIFFDCRHADKFCYPAKASISASTLIPPFCLEPSNHFRPTPRRISLNNCSVVVDPISVNHRSGRHKFF